MFSKIYVNKMCLPEHNWAVPFGQKCPRIQLYGYFHQKYHSTRRMKDKIEIIFLSIMTIHNVKRYMYVLQSASLQHVQRAEK